ncbi:phosphoenolpyruvate--protein phosphotransferase [Acidithiobacillus sp.]|uniref:phosphoenolpyruvate--protein phosphotransferase n=1 Tax=Acidithiobacillus sp. TaxID=1872118 RepID=UPI0025C5ACC6|nr:putative PEP-binding protein [Acidithiobacillus sp.]
MTTTAPPEFQARQGKVALLLVGHSRPMAEALLTLLRQVAPELRVGIAAGAGERGEELGTDATHILSMLQELDSPAGTVVLLDLGSALLSAQTAISLLDTDPQGRVTLCPAPYVEGALAAAIAAAGCRDAQQVCHEARQALASKVEQLTPADPATAPQASAPRESSGSEHIQNLAQAELTLTDPAGLHLRPAAALLRAAQKADEGYLARAGSDRLIPLDSLSRLLREELRQGERIRLYAGGADAREQLAAMVAALNSTNPDGSGQAPAVAATEAEPLGTRPRTAVPGRAMGPIYTLRQPQAFALPPTADDPEAELARIHKAWAQVEGERPQGDILAAQGLFLQDPALRRETEHRIRTQGLSAPAAWIAAVQTVRTELERIRDPILRARLSDLDDLSLRVLQALGLAAEWQLPDRKGYILLADDLPPSLARRLSPDRVLGVLDRRGGPRSHAAIVLRAAHIPYLVGLGAINVADGTEVAMDADTAQYWIDPPASVRATFLAKTHSDADLQSNHGDLGQLTFEDGSVVELWANVSSRAEAEQAAALGVKGVGLLRSEMLFLGASRAPSETEQLQQFTELLEPLGQLPVVLRLLDAGADKPFPFLQLDREPNPALGLRGIRALERRPDFFHQHLRAVLRAGHGRDLRLLLPMVTIPQEVARTRARLEAVHQELTAEGLAHRWPIPLGVMVEVPAVALRIDDFVPLADFFSIGSNDLGQYTWAVDREQGDLCEIEESGGAALLELCARVARQKHRPVSVCGEAAADPNMARTFIAQGIRRLSMAPALLPALVRALRGDGKLGN